MTQVYFIFRKSKHRIMAKPVEFTDANFEEVVLQSDKPVLVDFWAAWCGPCRAIAPSIEQMADEMEGSKLLSESLM